MSFEAQYHGPCENEGCVSGRILPGEQVQYIDTPGGGRDLVHVACPTPPPAQPVCPGCDMELPLTGKCDDCDG